MSELLAGAGDIFNNLVWLGAGLSFLLVAGVVIWFAKTKGYLERRPYEVTVFVPRADSTLKPTKARGRFIKEGKFEIAYSMNDVDVVPELKEKYIFDGKKVYFMSHTRGSYFPVTHFEAQDEVLKVEPTLDPSLKVTYIQGIKEEVARFTKPNPWMQYAPFISVVVACLILSIGVYVGNNMIVDSNTQLIGEINKVTQQLAESDIVLHKYEEAPELPSSIPEGFPAG